MAKQVSLKATLRPGIGRQHARRTRAAAMVPAVVYGSHLKPIPIQVEARAVERVFKHATSENMLVELSLDEGGQTTNRLAFIQEIQHHPLSDQVLHLDFHEVRADEKLHAHVVIVAVG
ncbi:MAG: 50S ribosomal protein L25 [Verrucomicrobia bacterium]|nr:50S ribosomal protein L25 [Verrucomicrobiota bacterium]